MLKVKTGASELFGARNSVFRKFELFFTSNQRERFFDGTNEINTPSIRARSRLRLPVS